MSTSASKKRKIRNAKKRGYSLEDRTAKRLDGHRNLLSKKGDVIARGRVISCKHQSSDYGLTKMTKWINEAKEDARKYGDGAWSLVFHLGGRSGDYAVIDADEYERLTRIEMEYERLIRKGANEQCGGSG